MKHKSEGRRRRAIGLQLPSNLGIFLEHLVVTARDANLKIVTSRAQFEFGMEANLLGRDSMTGVDGY